MLLQKDLGRFIVSLVVVLLVATSVIAAQRSAVPIPDGADPLLSASVGMGSEVTVLVLLDIDCPVCVDSIPFYKRLLALPRMDGTRKRLVVLAQRGVVPLSDLIAVEGFKPHKLTSGPRAVRDVPTAPWVFVIGPDGKRIGAWEGRLTAKQEAEVIAKIGS